MRYTVNKLTRVIDMFFKRKKKLQAEPEVEAKEEPLLPNLSTGIIDADTLVADYIKNNGVKVDLPVPQSLKSTAMDSASINGIFPIQSYGQVNQRILAYYVASSSFIGYYACALIAQHWLIQKGCSLKARDATRNWYEITDCSGGELDAGQIKFIETCDKAYKLRQNLVQAVTFNNVFGIRHILFKHRNPDFDYEQPFNPDAFGPGEYAGISQIDPYWCTAVIDDDDMTDPTRIGFYEPTYWMINGKKYHKSHFVILYGEEVADYLKPTYRYGGVPLVQRAYERIYSAEAMANEALQLAKTKRLSVQKVDTAKVMSDKAQFVQKLNVMRTFRDNYGIHVIDKNDDFEQIDTALTDFDSVTMNQYQLVCSIFDTPASKMLETGHNGFSTGETDDDYYIQTLEEVRANTMNLIVEAHYARLLPSEITPKLGIAPTIEPVWNPLKVMSESERADVRLKNSQADAAWFQTGAIDNVDIRDRLSKDRYSGFEGLAMPEQIIDDPEIDDSDQSALDGVALDYLQETDGKWYVYSEMGKVLSKGYGTEGEAKKRLAEIEMFKNMDK